MYPTRLNVISPQKQRHIRLMFRLSFVEHVIAILFVVIAVCSIFTVIARVFLQSYFADVALQSLRTQNPTKEINQRVVDINNTLKTAHAIQSQYVPWTHVLSSVASRIPKGITLSSVRFSKPDKTLTLVGTAASRDDLLALKSELESLDAIQTVSIPLSEFARTSNIPFSLTIPFLF